MEENAKAMVLASFVGDSLALGAHWIYETAEIEEKLGRVDQLRKPLSGSYHPNREKGEFTHYGDQTLVLLEALAEESGRFSLGNFATAWQGLFAHYDGYQDKATSQTLDNFAAKKGPEDSGSNSSDLGGPARMAPLVYCYRNDLAGMLVAVEQQTRMTHASSTALVGAAFLAKTVFSVLQGNAPSAAVESLLEEGVPDLDLDIRLRSALDSQGEETRDALLHLGQMCGTANALPGVVHLVTKYEDDLELAFIENVMAGGDSASRGLAAGMILGAHCGMNAIPERWLNEMRQYPHIADLLLRLP